MEPEITQILTGYLDAKERIVGAGYGEDLDWAESLHTVRPDTHYVFRETAWVILNSGFRYQVARKLWPRLSEVFHQFDISKVDASCLVAGLKVLNHPGKMRAIIQLAEILRTEGIEAILRDAKDPEKLTRLPWIGKTTCWHLAKVLGQDVIKPDVHLQRAAKATGYERPLDLAAAIQVRLGEPLTVIDSVLWRYGEQRLARGWPDWPELFQRTAVSS